MGTAWERLFEKPLDENLKAFLALLFLFLCLIEHEVDI
jgi:hypothetical protein